MTDPQEGKSILEVMETSADGDYRTESLAVMLGAARVRRRKRRTVATCVVTAAIVGMASLGIHYQNSRPGNAGGAQIASKSAGEPSHDDVTVVMLSDEELLECFEDEPVALVGEPGNRRLIRIDHY